MILGNKKGLETNEGYGDSHAHKNALRMTVVPCHTDRTK